ncbi:hypothetical protein CEXT_221071 [Caerostris extrusa]|uniref:Uncharacterized protein n=1 Tax=Caerostris extrusa TaxID=172846 RepID=A0AAV4X1X3_CAEEX|nr:hypothetical protein CEXT_221071 [Caerostris extrusa]
MATIMADPTFCFGQHVEGDTTSFRNSVRSNSSGSFQKQLGEEYCKDNSLLIMHIVFDYYTFGSSKIGKLNFSGKASDHLQVGKVLR